MENGSSQELNSHWLGWQTQKRPQGPSSTLQAAPWVKQCLGTAALGAAVFWQLGCVSGGGSCLQTLLWALNGCFVPRQKLCRDYLDFYQVFLPGR